MANEQSNGNAPCNGGLLGWLFGLLSVPTPTYQGQAAKPAQRGGMFGGSTPTYRQAPTAPQQQTSMPACSDVVAVPVELPPTEPGGDPRNVTIVLARRE
jgi:hypothetical protein